MKCIVPVFALALVMGGVPAYASHCDDPGENDIGSGRERGCSGIGGVTATDLNDDDCFAGRLSRIAVDNDDNHKGKGDSEDLDDDGISDSMEECINDALIGHCGDVYQDDAGDIDVDNISNFSKNRTRFDVDFDNTSTLCFVTECSDGIDNDSTEGTDYPNDPDCTSYSDDNETDPDCQNTNDGDCSGSLDS
jgi:hypothetical protein